MACSSRRHGLHVERLEARVVLASAVAGVGNGLIANYFSDPELQNLALSRVDSTVNFDWGQNAPAAPAGSGAIAVPADNFSVRWTGKVQAQFDESYTFYTQSDEGVALWVNGQQLIDNFTDHTLAEDSGTITLKAGELYDIKLEYYDNQFDASIKFFWSSPSTSKQIIPATQLYSDAGWSSSAWLNTAIGGAAGSVNSLGATYNVIGNGSGVGGTSDQFEYLYQTLEGDGVLIARVSGQDNLGGASAGIMVRDSLSANSSFAALYTSSNGTPEFETRAATGQSATSSTTGGISGGNYWLKLVRDGTFLRGYVSTTGADGSWTSAGTKTVAMDRTVYVGLVSTSGTVGGLNHAQFKSVAVTPVVPLGAGLDAVRDYSFGQVFVDVAKQARTPSLPNLGPTAPTDANGWPTSDFMTILISGFTNQAHLYNGTYKVSFTGQADVGTWLTPGGQIANKVYNAGTNTTTCDLIVNASEAQDGWYIALQMTNTRRTAASALGSGITNLKAIRPGYAANTTQVFQNSYLEFLKQFSTLRFMDWGVTNNNPVVEWSERTTLTSARQSSTKGVAWEYAIQLANQLHKDLWVNIPAKASDDYVTQLATLLKNTLDPDRVVYVEYSNEVWNGIFTQTQENTNAAIAEVNAGNSPLNADGETNTIYWGWRRVAKRLKEISDQFGAVWGADQINGRVRPVLAGQHANTEVIRQGIEFIERTYGAPSKYFYGLATAPYFAFSDAFDSVPRTVDEILSALQGSVNSLYTRYWQHDTYARRYGLANLTYEGGPHIDGGNNLTNKKLAQLDPRMKDVVTSYLNGWFAQGAGLFNWFVSGPTNWTSNGMWGVTNSIENPGAPKNQGIIDVANTARQALTYGISVPASFDARAIAGSTQPYTTTYYKNPGKGKSFDYFIRVPKAGSYKVVFNAGAVDSSEQLRIAVNGSAVRTTTLKNTGGLTTFGDTLAGTFQLVEGMNLIHVTSVNEAGGWNLQTVTVAPGDAPDAAPTVATPAAANPTSTTGKTSILSVLGADNGGESNLVYSWEAIDEQPMSVTFSANGSNAAKNTTATFTRAGTYTLRVTISDGVSIVTSSVVVTVNQLVTSVSVAPSGTAIANNETKQLTATAKDQFGVQLYTQPTFTWGVDNAFGTVSSTGVYQSPVSGLGTATVRATANGVSGTATVATESPRPADNPANALPGIDYSYYEGSYSTVPNLDTLTPIKSGLLPNFSVAPKEQADGFAFQYNGYVYVPGSGTYTFYTTSDDGSKLWIGGQLVVDNDGKHSAVEKSGSIILDVGWHLMKLGFFDSSGQESLSVSFNGPGLTGKQLIPDANLERVNRAPQIVTPPAASPNPVTGTNSALSVVGTDESGENTLTYTWSAINNPPAGVSFSANGTNAAKNTAATFTKAGSYVLQVSISDGLLSTTATVNVTVAQAITTITVAPSNPNVLQNRTQQFSATAFDQFGQIISNPTLVWAASVNGGTIDNTGLYTAPDAVGSYTITATGGTAVGSTNLNVIVDAAPIVATPAAASPNPVIGSTTNLSVLGADDGGEANLTYTWAATAIPGGAAAPVFSANGSNAAKNAIATFSSSGTYTLQVTISDGFKSVISSIDVNVGINAPTVVNAASATPNPVSGNTTTLSVLGNGPSGEGVLFYTWETTGSPPAAVVFSQNGTNAAKNSTATFTKAGNYTIRVTISDGSLSITSSVSVTVSQTVTTVTLNPTSAAVAQGATRQFTASAFDQFGDAITSPGSFTWSLTSTGTAGTISQSGLYTAPLSGSATDTITATIGPVGSTVSGSATVTVVAPSIIDLFGQSADIGSPSIPGGYTFNGTTYTVQGSGADIWTSSDQFHFVYQSFTGDGQIIARVASVQNTHSRAKAGVMFRETLNANSKLVDLVVSPDNTTALQYRTGTGAGMSSQSASNTPAPYWVKLVRLGNTFTGYRSPDGITWTQVASIGCTMGSTIYVGLAVTSHNNSALNTSTFNHVSISSGTNLVGRVISSDLSMGSTTGNNATAGNVTASNRAVSNLFDGNTSTYYDSLTSGGTGRAWAGLDLGIAHTITQIRYAARRGYAMRLVGGKFQASNTADFSSGVINLYTITAANNASGFITKSNTIATPYRYVRYLAPAGSLGGMAEIAFSGI